jgi:hypothetical protein
MTNKYDVYVSGDVVDRHLAATVVERTEAR